MINHTPLPKRPRCYARLYTVDGTWQCIHTRSHTKHEYGQITGDEEVDLKLWKEALVEAVNAVPHD